MQNLRLFPYQMASESGRDLAQVLNCLRIRHEGTYRPKVGHCVINWGNSASPEWAGLAANRGVRILNRPNAVGNASNKLKTFQILSAAGIRTPEFTTSHDTALNWYNRGFAVVERHKLNGHSGEGIRISYREGGANANAFLKQAPLYTKYIHKEQEFRVHVFRGQVIDYIQKKKRNGAEELPEFDRYVYSTERGWVFVRQGAENMPAVKNIALSAVNALGLDFGAVDVVVLEGVPYVLEVNTSPGLAGTTLVNYANAIRQFMGAAPLGQEVIERLVPGREEPVVNEPIARHAAVRAQAVERPQARLDANVVTLTIDRNTARTLKQLLNQLAL